MVVYPSYNLTRGLQLSQAKQTKYATVENNPQQSPQFEYLTDEISSTRHTTHLLQAQPH